MKSDRAVKQIATVKRARARRFAMQATYQYLLSDENFTEIARQFKEREDTDKFDNFFFDEILEGISEYQSNFELQITPFLDRKVHELGYIERAILLVGCFELNGSSTPYKVVINEAIILAKKFAGDDSHKYINGILDKVNQKISG